MASVAVVSRIIEKRKQQRAQVNSQNSSPNDNEKSSVFRKRPSLQWDKVDLMKLLAGDNAKVLKKIVAQGEKRKDKHIRIAYWVMAVGILCILFGVGCFICHFKLSTRFEDRNQLIMRVIVSLGPFVTGIGVMLVICGYVSIQVAEDQQKAHMRDLLRSYTE